MTDENTHDEQRGPRGQGVGPAGAPTEATADEADDDLLLEELRAVMGRLDPVSPEMLAAARASFLWHTIDAELAQLAHDSVLDAERMALVRGVGVPELLTFESPGLTVELEAVTTAAGLRLLGQLSPARPAEVEVRHAGGTVTVTADDLGRFATDDLLPGPVSLRCRSGDAAVDTDWFLA